jgi:hypothetical protein
MRGKDGDEPKSIGPLAKEMVDRYMYREHGIVSKKTKTPFLGSIIKSRG